MNNNNLNLDKKVFINGPKHLIDEEILKIANQIDENNYIIYENQKTNNNNDSSQTSYLINSKKINKIIKKLKKSNPNEYKEITKRVVIILALALFIASNPIRIFALSSLQQAKETGFEIVDLLNIAITKILIVFAAIHLSIEYFKGSSTNRIFDTLKKYLVFIFLVVIVSKLPLILNKFL